MATGLSNFLPALVPTIQSGYLEHAIQEAIQPEVTFRAVAERRTYPNRIGQTITDTKAGLKAPVTTFMDPTTNTNFDNGLVPTGWQVEQFTFTLGRLGDTQDLNIVTEKVGIIPQFVHNNVVNAVQAMQSVDRLAQRTLYGSYVTGNTVVRVASSGTALSVSDIRGFQNAPQLGVMATVSTSNPLNAFINGNAYSVVGTAADATNAGTGALNAVSGVLTLATAVSSADGAVGNTVVASNAPGIVRPNAKASFGALTASDMLTMATLRAAVTQMRNNRVPTINGAYNLYLDPTSSNELFNDPEFRQAWQGLGHSTEYQKGTISALLGVRFMPTTELAAQPHPTIAGLFIHRPILVGAGALIEATFSLDGPENDSDNQSIHFVDGIKFVNRMPLDRLGEIMANSWTWGGAMVCPTDMTATSATIPTASNAVYKRAILIEHIG